VKYFTISLAEGGRGRFNSFLDAGEGAVPSSRRPGRRFCAPAGWPQAKKIDAARFPAKITRSFF
jgi:hypothetical protein